MHKKARALLLLALALITGCSDSPPKPAAADPWVLVQPAAAPIDPSRRTFGTVRAADLHLVSTETGGRAVDLAADLGDRVRRGDLLVVLDNVVAARRLDAAREDLSRAEAELGERMRNEQRVEGLVSIGATSASDAERASTERQAATSAAAAARAELAAAERGLAAVEIRAPDDGQVAARYIERSAVAAPGALLFELDGDGAREIVAHVPESVARGLQRGSKLDWRVGHTSGRAVVERIGNRAGGSGARLVVVRVLDGDATPGALAELSFPAPTGAATATVPAAALLIARDGTRTLRVVDADRKVRELPVRLIGLSNGNALVAGAIAPGDAVIAAGAQHVAPGTRVRTRPAAR